MFAPLPPQPPLPYEAVQQKIYYVGDDAAYTRYSNWVDRDNTENITSGGLCLWAFINQPKPDVKNNTKVNVFELQDINLREEVDDFLTETTEKFSRDNILSEIRTLGNLPENWDGYGAIRVLPSCLTNAIQVMSELNCKSVESIDANPNGTVSVLWTNEDGDEIGLEVGSNEMSYYADIQGKEIYRSHIDIDKSNIKELAYLADVI